MVRVRLGNTVNIAERRGKRLPIFWCRKVKTKFYFTNCRTIPNSLMRFGGRTELAASSILRLELEVKSCAGFATSLYF